MTTLDESDATVAAAMPTVPATAASAAVDSDIKIADAAASASSSESTRPTDITDSVVAPANTTSSASSSPNTASATSNTNTKNACSLEDTDAENHSGSNNVNDDDNSLIADKYITRLISGDVISLPRKKILIAVVKQYAEDKKAEEQKIKGEVEESEKQVTSADEEVAAAEEALRAAEKRVKEANEKRGIAVSKDRNLKEQALKAKLAVEDVEAQLNDADDAAIEAIAGFVQKVQNSEERDEVEGKGPGVDGSGKNDEEGENRDVSQHTPVAGKRKREEDSSDENEEPASKERKLDESEGNGGFELPDGAEIDAELGVVFNSPFRPQLEMQCDAPFESDEKNSSTSTSKISIKASILRPFVLDAINEYRAKLGQRSVPLIELIFLVNDKEAQSLEDGGAVSESVLLSSEVTVGIKHFPELTFEKLMRPFQVFQKLQGSKQTAYP